MRFSSRASLASILVVGSLAWRHESPSRESGPPSLELKLIKGPRWMGNCVELSFQRTNVSKSSVFLDPTYEGVKIYSSVRDASNTVGQGPGEAWMLVYGWTDIVSEPIELVPGGKRQNTLCIADTFPVKQTGKETRRQVRVQGKLRVVQNTKFRHGKPSTSHKAMADGLSSHRFGENRAPGLGRSHLDSAVELGCSGSKL
jgi:hypothetical protein